MRARRVLFSGGRARARLYDPRTLGGCYWWQVHVCSRREARTWPRDRKVQVFRGTRNLYSRAVDGPRVEQHGFMCLSGNERYEAINFSKIAIITTTLRFAASL